MFIKRLHLKNFRCYESLDMDFEKKLTVIVGENGKGKTAIFDSLAIALAPYLEAFDIAGTKIRPKDVRRIPVYKDDGMHISRMESRYPVSIAVEAESVGGEPLYASDVFSADGSVEVSENLKAFGSRLLREEGTVLPVLAYYGTSRIWVDSNLLNERDKSLQERKVGYEFCLEPSSSYNTFGKWFGYISQCSSSCGELIYKAVQKAVDRCLQSTGLSGISYSRELESLVVYHPDMGELIVDDLSDGSRCIISMAADLAYRMVRLNPFLGERSVIDTPGVVLIDEVDMHLHPSWQQTILLDLQQAFPNIQFIVTTHSPQVLSSVPAETIRILVWGKNFEGIKLVDFSLGAESTQLLQEIQNVSTRIGALPIVQDLKRYLELISKDQWDTEEALELRKKLDAWAKGHEPALLRADMDIRLRKFRRKRS